MGARSLLESPSSSLDRVGIRGRQFTRKASPRTGGGSRDAGGHQREAAGEVGIRYDQGLSANKRWGGVASDFVISYISWDLIIGVIRRYQTYHLPG